MVEKERYLPPLEWKVIFDDGEPFDYVYPGPNCNGKASCRSCPRWLCNSCKRWRPWCTGGEGNDCDLCWYRKNSDPLKE